MGIGRTAKRVGEHLREQTVEAVGELALTALACILLGALIWAAHLSWSASPRLTVAGSVLAGLAFIHGAWTMLRAPSQHPRRRGVAATTTALLALGAGTSLFLAFYATGCDCQGVHSAVPKQQLR
ncbi:hypothetical protein [Streptomyces sp. NPDC019224]|uniref:hypothetical protein n=1 Tax=Streptomyces sp. NPDC019224 TaxID=3154484 RepID=UPI0034049572